MPTRTRRGLSRPFIFASVAFGAVVVLWATLWFAALAAHETRDKTTTYGDVRELRIDGDAGDIKVIAEARDDVRVDAHTEWSLSKPDQSQRFSNGTLQLEGGCGFWGSFGPNGCKTDFTIHVPRSMPISASVSSGDVHLVGGDGPVDIDVSSGDVHVADTSGPLKVRSDSGDMDVSGYGGRDVSVDGSSGDIELRTRSMPSRVSAVTDSGDVTVAVPGGIAYDVDVDTDSGDQDVDVDQSPNARNAIEARTSSGDVKVVRLADAR